MINERRSITDINQELFILWKSLLNNKISDILIKEYELYSSILNDNDDPIEHIKFYSHYEPLCKIAAEKTFKQLVNNQLYIDDKVAKKSDELSLLLSKKRKLVIYVGEIGLAHGCVLRGHISSLPIDNRESLLVAFTHLEGSKTKEIEKEYGIKAIALSDYINGIKAKYIHLATIMSGLNSKHEVIWWGMSLGMVFTFSLARIMQSTKPIHSFVSCKYKFSFSPTYVDRLYDGTPKTQGYLMSENRGRYIPALFDETDTKPRLNISKPLMNKVNNIKSLLERSDGPIISAFSRPQKICRKSYIDAIKNILTLVPKSKFLVFGFNTNLIDTYFGRDMERSIINIEWLNYKVIPHLIGKIDLFTDPFPFGAGFTLISAAMQGVPIVTTRTNLSEYPGFNNTLIKDIVSQHKIMPSDQTTILLETMLGETDTYIERSVELLTNRLKAEKLTEAQMKFVYSQYFNNPSKSIL